MSALFTAYILYNIKVKKANIYDKKLSTALSDVFTDFL